MEELGDPTDSENEGEGEGEEEAEAEAEAEDEREGEDENSDSGDTPIQLQINLTTEVEKEVDRFLESEDEQFTFEEFYCMLGPWALGRQKEVLAALKRLVNGYSVSPAKLIMDDDDESMDMDELVFRPNPVERLEISNSDDDE